MMTIKYFQGTYIIYVGHGMWQCDKMDSSKAYELYAGNYKEIISVSTICIIMMHVCVARARITVLS